MDNINNYRNKNIGILGLGISGLAAINILKKLDAKIFAFDDKNEKKLKLPRHIWVNYKNWPWNNLEVLIVSPGIPINNKNKHQAILLAIKHNVKIINDVDLFTETKPKARIIGITGTNGKSTTVALLYHILKYNNIKCEVGGNYGYPACKIIDPGEDGIIILELSSYQLDGSTKLKLDLAAIINITPDHIEYHGSFDNYRLSKLKILNFLVDEGAIVIDKKNQSLNKLISGKNYKDIRIIKANTEDYKKIIGNNQSLVGHHNLVNASIAISLAKNLELSNKNIESSIESFCGLPHRMETIFYSSKIKIINDSKSTNGDSTAAALRSYNNIFWIVGGKPKIDGIGEATHYLNRVIECFLIGNHTDFFTREIKKYNKSIPLNKCETLENAVSLTIRKALVSSAKSVVILLSPSAASFDQFESFEDRGNKFKKIVSKNLKEAI